LLDGRSFYNYILYKSSRAIKEAVTPCKPRVPPKDLHGDALLLSGTSEKFLVGEKVFENFMRGKGN
jgi:hypothetical protein